MSIQPSQNSPVSRPQFVPLGARPSQAVQAGRATAPTPATQATQAARTTQATQATRTSVTAAPNNRFSVLNDFRYLTDSDKTMLGAVTGEKIEPGFTDKPGSASAFALQLALDRRTGALAPNQPVTSVYLRNAAADLQRANVGRANFQNPYSGDIMAKATAWLDAHGQSRADFRV